MPDANAVNQTSLSAYNRYVGNSSTHGTIGPYSSHVTPNSVSPYGWNPADFSQGMPYIPPTVGGPEASTNNGSPNFGNSTIDPNSRGPFMGWEIDNFNNPNR